MCVGVVKQMYSPFNTFTSSAVKCEDFWQGNNLKYSACLSGFLSALKSCDGRLSERENAEAGGGACPNFHSTTTSSEQTSFTLVTIFGAIWPH